MLEKLVAKCCHVGAHMPVLAFAVVSIRQHTSAYVSIRQHTSAYVSIRQHTACLSSRLPSSVRMLQRTVARRICRDGESTACIACCPPFATLTSTASSLSAYVSIRQHTSAYVSIRQYTPAYVSIRQHTSAYMSLGNTEDQSIASSLCDKCAYREALSY